MSNVLKRHRNLSDYAFYNNALKIRSEVLFITNNEKYVPKRRRIIIGNKTLNHALDIVEYIAKANAAFPASQEMLFIRKWNQQKAIGECEALIECLRVIMEFNNGDKNRKLMSLVYLINSEIDLIRRWMKASKLTKHSKKYAGTTEPINNTTISESTASTTNNASSDENTKPAHGDFMPTEPSPAETDKAVSNLMTQLMVLLEETTRPGDKK